MDEPKKPELGDVRKGIYAFAERTRGQTPNTIEVFPVGHFDPQRVADRELRKACHDAGLLDENGNLRKIMGEPTLTEDGVVVFVGGGTYGKNGHFEPITSWQQVFDGRYSTREAAERAAKGGQQ